MKDSRKRIIQEKINAINEHINNLDCYLPETYEYLMQELDKQRCILSEIEIHEVFTMLDSEFSKEVFTTSEN